MERKKDYQKRSKSHHNKQNQLQALKKIAKERNPDEFYIGMTKTKLVNGVHFNINPNEESLLTPAQRLLIKTGNTNYIRLKIQQEKKKVQKMEEEYLMATTQADPKSHVMFADTKAGTFQAKTFLEKDHSTVQVMKVKRSKSLLRQKEKLDERKKRLKHMVVISDKLETSKNLSNDKFSVGRKTIKKETKESAAVYRFQKRRNK